MKHIEAREVYQRLQRGENLILLDIREPEELDICQIPGSLHIPMHDVPTQLSQLDPDTPIVVYCHAGVRSLYVSHFLSDKGYRDVYNLRGGITQWTLQVDPTMPMY